MTDLRRDAHRLTLPGPPRLAGISDAQSIDLLDGWMVAMAVPGTSTEPSAAVDAGLEWIPAPVPGTIASAWRASSPNAFDLDTLPDFDASDVWYRTSFSSAEPVPGETVTLAFDGLATLAEVWLNGTLVLSSANMFLRHAIDVTALLRSDNELAIRFRSLRADLETRRPRPRWKTKLVEHQQLRWHRATLLGRMPGWSPPVRAVGPWRPVRLERQRALQVLGGDLWPSLDDGRGIIDVAMRLGLADGTRVEDARLECAGRSAPLVVAGDGAGAVTLHGQLVIPDVAPWWPHTHGDQPRYPARLVVRTGSAEIVIDAGEVAFRRVRVETTDGGFSILINGEPVFCRGACWSTEDIVSLGSDDLCRERLRQARAAGMNMIRVGGTMVYGSDAFYDACDEFGILVWQDFMFANMDYPVSDAAFASSVEREAVETIARIRRHPSLAVLCGNSEVEQQAAMLGLDAALWTNPFFREVLPGACEAGAPGIPFWPSSPAGGVLPFHVDSGVAHYYGVGAYMRPLEDARRSNVRFTSECLGFSNVPEPAAIDELLPNGESPIHHPRWKARVPRDHGTGWDFEDVRDFYLARLCGVDPGRGRYAEMDRYLALSRVVTGEVMSRTIGEWRRPGSSCRGALIWFFQDLWMGAGWGLLDSSGRPKAAYYQARRAMQPRCIAISDEGVNGLQIHVANEGGSELHGEVRLTLLRGSTVVATGSAAIEIAARGEQSLSADALLGRFLDSAYAYRFGPAGHDVVSAALIVGGEPLSESFHFPSGFDLPRASSPLVGGHATRIADGVFELELSAAGFAQSVAIDCGRYVPDDCYFHMMPGTVRRVLARSADPGARFSAFVQALNASEGVSLETRTGGSRG